MSTLRPVPGAGAGASGWPHHWSSGHTTGLPTTYYSTGITSSLGLYDNLNYLRCWFLINIIGLALPLCMTYTCTEAVIEDSHLSQNKHDLPRPNARSTSANVSSDQGHALRMMSVDTYSCSHCLQTPYKTRP